MLSPVLQILNIKDFATNEALHTVLSRCMSLRSDYWLKKITPGNDLFVMVYPKAQDQIAALRAITKLINKGIIPPDKSLDTLPVFVDKFTNLLESRKRRGNYERCDKETEAVVAKYRATNKEYFVLYTSSPLDVKEDHMQYSIYTPTEDRLFSRELERVSPDVYKYLSSRASDGTSRSIYDPEMEKKVLEIMNRKLCITCGKEPVNKKCSVCGCTYYCDAECQNINWDKHKVICQALRLMKMMLTSAQVSDSA